MSPIFRNSTLEAVFRSFLSSHRIGGWALRGGSASVALSRYSFLDVMFYPHACPIPQHPHNHATRSNGNHHNTTLMFLEILSENSPRVKSTCQISWLAVKKLVKLSVKNFCEKSTAHLPPKIHHVSHSQAFLGPLSCNESCLRWI